MVSRRRNHAHRIAVAKELRIGIQVHPVTVARTAQPALGLRLRHPRVIRPDAPDMALKVAASKRPAPVVHIANVEQQHDYTEAVIGFLTQK